MFEVVSQRMAIDQAELNAQAQIPCKFFLLNPSQGSDWDDLKAGEDYCEINPLHGNLQEQVHFKLAVHPHLHLLFVYMSWIWCSGSIHFDSVHVVLPLSNNMSSMAAFRHSA